MVVQKHCEISIVKTKPCEMHMCNGLSHGIEFCIEFRIGIERSVKLNVSIGMENELQ